MAQTLVVPPPRPAASRTRGLLTIILLGQFMAIIDVTIVNVAAPTLRADLSASGAGLQLVISGYTVAYAVLLITGARLGAIGGHRRVFLAGLAVFTLASLACGSAGTTEALIVFRAAQGFGAALLVPQVFSLIQRHYQGAARARAIGLYGAVIAGAAVVGQVLGGILVDADLAGTGWRPVFLVNVPVGIVLFGVGARLLPADTGRVRRALDLPGVVALAVAVLAFVLPLVLGHEAGWPAWTWAVLAGSGLLFAGFVLTQRRAAAPLIPARVLRAHGLLPAAAVILTATAAYAGFLFVIALHVQVGLGYRPLAAGLVLVPGAVAFATASLTWRRLPASWHPRVVAAGMLVGAAGFAGMALAVRDGAGVGWVLESALIAFGLGFGAAFSPLVTLGLSRVPPADAADASGVLATVIQLGQVVGVASFGSLYLSLDGGSARATAVTYAVLAAVSVVGAVTAGSLPGFARR